MRPSKLEVKAPKCPSDLPYPSLRLSHDSPTRCSTRPDSSNNIKVVARFRPKTDCEVQLEASKPQLYKYLGPTSIQLAEEIISFDRVFDQESSQEEVFEAVGRPVVEDVLEGYNGTLFAYGQTGSGKTYTMMGLDVLDEGKRGIMPRAASAIFQQVNQADSEVEFILRCSMLEIYKETLRDLLGPDSADLRIKEDPRKGIYVQGLTEVWITCEEEMLEVIAIGEQMRTVSATKCNAVSSRSHQLFLLEVKQRLPNDSEKRGILNLVDLAGSEKVNRSGVTGNALQETKKINLSLSCLGNVIHALVTSADHVPYRESKLTRLLQESLGGNFKTTVLVALSPCHRHYDETYNSIKFVQRAKHIRNKVTLNIKSSPEAYQAIIDKLTDELKKTQTELEAARLIPRVVMGGGSGKRCRNGLVTADGSFRDKEGLSTDLEVSTDGIRTRRTIVMSCNHIDELKKAAELAGEQRERVRSLEGDKQALREKVTELEESLRSANKKLLKQQREALDYKSKYHNAIIMMRKDNDECDLMKKYNSELMQTVKQLRLELEQLDEKFSKSLDEKLQTSSSTILEFDDRVDSHYSHSHNSSSGSDDLPMEEEVHMPPPPKPLSIGPEETTKKYFETIRMKLDPDSTLTKESLLRQLQNDLLQ